ncbi:hypothetical protein VXE24_14475, partial [Acinetobacter variabilis]
NSKIGFGDLILLLRYFFKLKVSTHPSKNIKCLLDKLYSKKIWNKKYDLVVTFLYKNSIYRVI